MKSRFFNETLPVMLKITLKMLDQLQYETNYSKDKHFENILVNGVKKDQKLFMQMKQSRKGLVKVTIEVEMPIRKLADYEERKRVEISLLHSIEAFVCETEDYTLGV